MPNDCPYCGDPYLNFIKNNYGVDIWIDETEDGEYRIAAPYMLSIPINFCPFCGRSLTKEKK